MAKFDKGKSIFSNIDANDDAESVYSDPSDLWSDAPPRSDSGSNGKSVLLNPLDQGGSDYVSGETALDTGYQAATAATEKVTRRQSIPAKPIRLPDSIEEPSSGKTTLLDDSSSVSYCVGWLLVISGPMVGNSFPLRLGRNSVGRGAGNAVRLLNDDAISREAQVYVIYDGDNNEYAIAPGGGSAISRVNGKRLDTSADLKLGDVIALSKKTSLRFIPACDESFQWPAED